MSVGVRRARAGAAVAAVLALSAACGNQTAADDPASAPSESPPSTSSPSPTATVDIHDHAVAPPGPLTGAIHVADILVYAKEPLSAEMIRRIDRLKGVEATEQFSMASVAVNSRVLNLAAVDPASYRAFTLSGKQDEIWDRVAGGELAVGQRLGRSIQDENAFVKLGSDETAPDVHIGAYADQPDGVNLVVNQAWGEELGMTEGNALLIATGIVSPQSVRKPIQKIIGGDGNVSVQMVDAVARYGLDPDAVQIAVPTGGSVASAVGTYHYRVSGNAVIPDPAWVAANIVTDTVPLLGTVSCDRVMMPQLKAALAEIVERGLGDKIYQTAGCFYPRFIAGTRSLSNHAFGMAIDINSLQNQRGTPGQMDPEVVRIFEKWGFAWGGDWSWTDPMHFELARIVRGG